MYFIKNVIHFLSNFNYSTNIKHYQNHLLLSTHIEYLHLIWTILLPVQYLLSNAFLNSQPRINIFIPNILN